MTGKNGIRKEILWKQKGFFSLHLVSNNNANTILIISFNIGSSAGMMFFPTPCHYLPEPPSSSGCSGACVGPNAGLEDAL